MASLSLRRVLLLLNISILALLCTSQPLPPPTAFNASVAVGQAVDLVCSVVGYSGTIPLSLSIMKVSDPTATSTTVTNEDVTVTLSIEATSLQDSGMYRCTASTTIGEIMSETVFFNLAVRDELALVTPLADAMVPPGGDAVFTCNFNRALVVSWFRGTASQQPLSQGTSKYLHSGVGGRVLTVTNVTYLDMGSYVCQVTDNFLPVRHSASLSLVPAYVPLMRRVGQFGQSTIVTRDQLKIDCRDYIAGVPGASLIYWQRDIVVDPRNVTGQGRYNRDPFVDDQSRLDFSASGVEDTGRYQCTAVDVLGVRVEQEFYVEVTHVSGFYLWNEWYMILVYCIAIVTILALVVIALWFGFSVKFNFCVKASKVVRKKERVRRSERQLVYKTTVTDEGIEAYATGYDEEHGEFEEVHDTHDEEEYGEVEP